VQIQDDDGKTAIHLAAENGYAFIVQLLLEDFKRKGMNGNAIKRILEVLKTRHWRHDDWIEKVQKFPDCVRILKPYIPEL
jgi:hypothetical protein